MPIRNACFHMDTPEKLRLCVAMTKTWGWTELSTFNLKKLHLGTVVSEFENRFDFSFYPKPQIFLLKP